MAISKKIIKSYSELVRIPEYEDRLEYLRLKGNIGTQTFGGKRDLNQILYSSAIWRSLRKKIILRDAGYDLGHKDYLIPGSIYVHHINPITIEDVLNNDPIVFDEENLISTSFKTHNLIHYGNKNESIKKYEERRPGDTTLW